MTHPSVLEVPSEPAGPDVPVDLPPDDPGGPAIDDPAPAPMTPDSVPEIEPPDMVDAR